MLQILAALALALGFGFFGGHHARPMDGAGGPPVPGTTPPPLSSPVTPMDGAGGPPTP